MQSVTWNPTIARAEKARLFDAANKNKKTSINSNGPSLLDTIPPEARNHIVEYLLPKDALIVSLLNSYWHEHVRHCGTLWAEALQRRFPISSERFQKELAAEKALRDGYFSYTEGVDYVKAIANLAKDKYGAIYSHEGEQKTVAKRTMVSSFMLAFSSLNPFGSRRDRHRILVVGPESAGKKTILYKLNLGEVVTTVPAIGFNIQTVVCKQLNFTCWDMGGPDRIREVWREYYENASALMFVVDSNDITRLGEASRHLKTVITESQLAGAPVLVIANKQDLPNANTIEQIAYEFRKSLGDSRCWCVKGASAKLGVGLREGLSWLVNILDEVAIT